MDLKTESQLRQEIDDAWGLIRQYQAAMPALHKDAERYRWLRDKAYTAVAVQLVQHMPGEMDGAIDHAMQMDAQDAALRARRLLVLPNFAHEPGA